MKRSKENYLARTKALANLYKSHIESVAKLIEILKKYDNQKMTYHTKEKIKRESKFFGIILYNDIFGIRGKKKDKMFVYYEPRLERNTYSLLPDSLHKYLIQPLEGKRYIDLASKRFIYAWFEEAAEKSLEYLHNVLNRLEYTVEHIDEMEEHIKNINNEIEYLKNNFDLYGLRFIRTKDLIYETGENKEEENFL